MAVSQGNMWLIVSLTTVINTSSIIFQTQVFFLFQMWQQYQSNLLAVKDIVAARNSARIRYRRMKLSYVLFLVQKARRINRYVLTV